MSLITCIYIMTGGALGTLERYLVSTWALPISGELPWGTIIINVTGSFLIGFFGTLTLAQGRYPVAENLRQTVDVVAEAHARGAHVEGEIEAITGVEDDIGSDEEASRQSLPVALDFIRKTGIDVFAPAIGNAHGVYRAEPHLDAQRVSDIVAAQPIPIALHGGTGMTDAQFTDLIARGCAKVNISTALKVTYMQANLAFLRGAEERDSWDPPSLFTAVRAAVKDLAAGHMRRFGSVGRAG